MERVRIVDIIIGVITIFIIGYMVLVVVYDIAEKLEPKYTITFETINVTETKLVINTSENVTVVDIRGLEGCGPCQFNKGHLPGAIRSTEASMFYNYTSDIIVYSVDGALGETFCEQLVNHTYGRIYNLQGGWNAWGLA